MSNSKKNTKESQNESSHTMGLRLDDPLYQKLEKMSQEMNMKKSHLLKHAFMIWVNQIESVTQSNLMMVGKPTFMMMLDAVSDEKVREIGKSEGEYMVGLIQMRMLQMDEKIHIDKFIERNNRMLAKGSMGWFDTISNKKIDENTIQIYGMHSLNRKFSIFVEELFKILMNTLFKFEFDPENSNMTTNMVNFVFKKSK